MTAADLINTQFVFNGETFDGCKLSSVMMPGAKQTITCTFDQKDSAVETYAIRTEDQDRFIDAARGNTFDAGGATVRKVQAIHVLRPNLWCDNVVLEPLLDNLGDSAADYSWYIATVNYKPPSQPTDANSPESAYWKETWNGSQEFATFDIWVDASPAYSEKRALPLPYVAMGFEKARIPKADLGGLLGLMGKVNSGSLSTPGTGTTLAAGTANFLTFRAEFTLGFNKTSYGQITLDVGVRPLGWNKGYDRDGNLVNLWRNKAKSVPLFASADLSQLFF